MAERNKDRKLLQWIDKDLKDDDLRGDFPDGELLAFRQILDEVEQWVPDNDQKLFEPKAITDSPKEPKVRQLVAFRPISIAASLLIAGFFGWFYFSSSNTSHYADNGEQKRVILPDGQSVAIIFSNSSILWEEGDWSESKRILRLEGKAFFDVAKGSPFSVIADGRRVDVLGTQFEVSAYENSFEVSCYEGRVRATVDSKEIFLNGGEGGLYYKGNWENKIDLDTTEPGWFEGISKFVNAPLETVLNELRNVYGIEIRSQGVNLEKRFTGSFPHDDFELAVKIIAQPFGLTYNIQDEVLILSE